MTKASIDVLRDFAKGEVKFFVRPPAKQEAVNNAEIVSQLSEAFDPTKMDADVLQGNDDMDMDAVALDAGSGGDGRRRGASTGDRPSARRGIRLRDGLSVLVSSISPVLWSRRCVWMGKLVG